MGPGAGDARGGSQGERSSRPAQGFAFPFQPRRGPGLRFRPTSARGSKGNHLEASCDGFWLALWAPGSERFTPRGSDWGKENSSPFGKQKRIGGRPLRPGGEERRGSCPLEAAESAARPPRAPASSAGSAARDPRGPDLRSRGGSFSRVPDFSRPLQPRKDPALEPGRASESPGGLGGSETRDGIPEVGGKARFRPSLPPRPLGGELTLAEGPTLAASLPGRPSSSLGAAGGVYAVRFPTAPGASPAARESWCASSAGRLGVRPIDESKNNNDYRYSRTKPSASPFAGPVAVILLCRNHPRYPDPRTYSPPAPRRGRAGTNCARGPG